MTSKRFDHDHKKRDQELPHSDIDPVASLGSDALELLKKQQRLDNIDQANVEIDRLRKLGDKLTGELQDATMEIDVAKGRRDWAFSERDKVVLERESIRTLCDKLRRERDRAVSDLAEALRDSDDIKKQSNELSKENKELREKLEGMEKEMQLKTLQMHRSPSTNHGGSKDSAIDSDLQEWDTEHIDVDMSGLDRHHGDLGIELSGGRDDIHVPSSPIYVSSVGRGSFMDGKLKINDCILKIDNIDCRDMDRNMVLQLLRNANCPVSLTIRRRRGGKKYSATLHINNATGEHHGLVLDMGVYISRIKPGSAAAREGSIAIGDRIVSVNNHQLEPLKNVDEVMQLLESGDNTTMTLTLAKSSSTIAGPLSCDSSQHNIVHDEVKSPKTLSAATSPIKDTIRGSQEFVKKLMSGSSGSSQFKDYKGLGDRYVSGK